MEFNILYQRNTNGSVQQWQIFVDGNQYWTVSGKHNGKLVVSERTTVAGKNIGKANETSPEEQALAEVKSKYKKKLESGYCETLDSIDSTRLLEPMLAKEYKNYSTKIKFPIISSPKIDGVRINATKDGLFSRNGKPFVAVPHIHDALKSFFERHPYLVLDGELYNSEFKDNFDKIISLVRKSKPTAEDLAESEQLVQFWIFDVFRADGDEVLYAIDRKVLVKDIAEVVNNPSIKALDFKVCHSQEELDSEYSEYLKEGVEGQMLNTYNAFYQHKRTVDLLKRKEFQDAEYLIIDVVSGVGNREGCGKLILQIGEDTFDCSVKGSVEYMQELLRNKQLYIGKKATVKFQNFTPKGKPRFPVCIGIRDYE